MGKAVAEKVAAKLRYYVLSRDLMLKASDKFHVSQQTLLQALHDAPGLKDRYKNTKQIYIAYVRAHHGVPGAGSAGKHEIYHWP